MTTRSTRSTRSLLEVLKVSELSFRRAIGRRQTAGAHCRYGKPIASTPRLRRACIVLAATAELSLPFCLPDHPINQVHEMEPLGEPLRDEWIVGSASVEASPASPRFQVQATNRTAR